MSGMAAATALATKASSELMILRTRSVVNRSMSTDRGLRRSVVTWCGLFDKKQRSSVVVNGELVIGKEVIPCNAGDFGSDHFRDLFQIDRDNLGKHLGVLCCFERYT